MHYGRIAHLFTILLFLLSFNTIIFLDFYWTAIVPAGWKKWTFILLGAIWVFLSFIADCCSRKYERIANGDVNGEKFLEILTVYLHDDWEGAERLAKLELRQNPRDVEIVLFLATLYRHRERYAEAVKMHEILERLEGAERWYYEIYVEKNALNRALNGPEENEDTNENAETNELQESEITREDKIQSKTDQNDLAEGEMPQNDVTAESEAVQSETFLKNGTETKLANINSAETEIVETSPSAIRFSSSASVNTDSITTKDTETAAMSFETADYKTTNREAISLKAAASETIDSEVNSPKTPSSAVNLQVIDSLEAGDSDAEFSFSNNDSPLSDDILKTFHLRIVHPEDSESETNKPQIWDSAKEVSERQRQTMN